MAEDPTFKTALSKAMKYCSRREYCNNDIYRKLMSWGISDSDTGRIITILNHENFINELRYSSAYVKDKFNYNKWGKIKIKANLRQKNIPDSLINQALEGIDNETYLETLKNMINSHKKSVKAKNQYELKAKLLRYSLSKGFESSLVYDLLNDL